MGCSRFKFRHRKGVVRSRVCVLPVSCFFFFFVRLKRKWDEKKIDGKADSCLAGWNIWNGGGSLAGVTSERHTVQSFLCSFAHSCYCIRLVFVTGFRASCNPRAEAKTCFVRWSTSARKKPPPPPQKNTTSAHRTNVCHLFHIEFEPHTTKKKTIGKTVATNPSVNNTRQKYFLLSNKTESFMSTYCLSFFISSEERIEPRHFQTRLNERTLDCSSNRSNQSVSEEEFACC